MVCRRTRFPDWPANAASTRCSRIDYEPPAKAGVVFFGFKDQTISYQDDVLTGAGKPYTVFTPYKRNWLASLTPDALKPYESEENLAALARPPAGVKHGIPS